MEEVRKKQTPMTLKSKKPQAENHTGGKKNKEILLGPKKYDQFFLIFWDGGSITC
jgi:hypothetical protein